jgi:hypothetical protein
MIALLLVTKNEGPLLRLHLEHHLEAGVDVVAVADNMSSDDTPDIVREFGDAVVTTRFERFHERQAVRLAMLADLARARPVDWAIIADTDEFFWAPEPLPERLARAGDDAVAVNFDAKLYLPTALDPPDGTIIDQRIYRTSGPASPLHSSYKLGKTAYRAEWLLGLEPDHNCWGHEHLCERAPKAAVEPGEARAHHYMIQDEDQFVEKVVRLIEWVPPPSGLIARWRWQRTPKQQRQLQPRASAWKKEWWGVYQQGGRDAVREYYRTTYRLSEQAVAEHLAAGNLVLDDGLAQWRRARHA